jgi:4-hydroxy-3-polyprenylbenzoate decarboxylase
LKIRVGVSGARGSLHELRPLEELRADWEVETRLATGHASEKILFVKKGKKSNELKDVRLSLYAPEGIGCGHASGSFGAAGMVIAHYPIHAMPAIAAGISSNLLVRAADVSLKERRPLIVMARETPRCLGHLRTRAALAEADANLDLPIHDPPIPSSLTNPEAAIDAGDSNDEQVVLYLLPVSEPYAKRSDGGWAR